MLCTDGYYIFHFEVECYKIKFAGQIQRFAAMSTWSCSSSSYVAMANAGENTV